MAFYQPTQSTRAVEDFNYVGGVNPMDVIGSRFNDTAAYLSEVQRAKASATITIPVDVATTNFQLANFIPAGSLVSSLGIFFTENVATAAGTLAVGFGNVSADVSIVASTVLNGAGANFNINSFTSTSSKHKVEPGGNAIEFAAGSELWFGNTSDLWFQTIVATGVLTTPVDVKILMEYLVVSNV